MDLVLAVLFKFCLKSVVALDVGSSQLDEKIRQDNRVKVFENTDFRIWYSDKKFDIITCDVSFISVIELLPYIDRYANNDIIVLFKPQFEVGIRVKRSKRGVVRDEKAIREARAKFELAAARLGWIMQITQECEIKGKEGNAEFFYAFKKA